ncbi:large ribosomal subunit protein uL14mz [Cryptomeria japonica]|uniref:large ribosomal subunit protein uL14mz n=1 Tax=Cryptomeria japonica TaxID=3369 RepID=UPI0025ABB189|nr:large ribosomal subunit protein uL14mz [Cryptomeria japonica]
MWRRAATHLETLALLKQRAAVPGSGGAQYCHRFLSSSSSFVQSSATPFNRTDGPGLMGCYGNNVWGRSSAFLESMCQPSGGLDQLLSQQRRTFIQMRTSLKVVDNSGAKRVMCIQALKSRKGARLGDTIIASVKEAHARGKVKKGDVVYCVVVRAAMQRLRCDGSHIRFDDNAVVVVSKQGEPVGTRVFGPVPHELRERKHLKILTLAEHVV